MANGNDFKGGSPWGSPPGGGNGSGRGGQRPPNIDEVIEKIQKLINKLLPGGKSGGSKPFIFGIILLGFDPLIRNEIFALILITLMAFFYASAQVFSRYLKDLEVTLTNAVMGLVGFVLLIISSSIFEGQTINEIKNISFQSWLLILHSGIFVSIAAHMSMFYLYRMYPVNRVFPFYALFPVFGVLLTFIIFYEIPTLITFIGGIIVIVATYFINKEN